MAARSIKWTRFTSQLHHLTHSPLISRPSSIISRTHLSVNQIPSQNFSTSIPKMTESQPANSNALFEAIKNRHTYYQLNKDVPISDARIQEIVTEAVLNVPSCFNSQTARLVVLLGKEHDDFWDIVLGVLEGVTPKDHFEQTSQKIAGFKAGYGSILFYEDTTIVKGLQEKFALYAEKFPQWSEHTSAMHQFALWTALEAEGAGANLQHYNPIIDEKVAARWNIPQEWSLKAHLCFGGRAGPSQFDGKKEQQPLEKRLKVFGAKQ